jgi:hypothetical protein
VPDDRLLTRAGRLASELAVWVVAACMLALPFLLVGCEPWRPLSDTLADLADYLIPPK